METLYIKVNNCSFLFIPGKKIVQFSLLYFFTSHGEGECSTYRVIYIMVDINYFILENWTFVLVFCQKHSWLTPVRLEKQEI